MAKRTPKLRLGNRSIEIPPAFQAVVEKFCNDLESGDMSGYTPTTASHYVTLFESRRMGYNINVNNAGNLDGTFDAGLRKFGMTDASITAFIELGDQLRKDVVALTGIDPLEE